MEKQVNLSMGAALNGFREVTTATFEGVLKAQHVGLSTKFDAARAELNAKVAHNAARIEQLRAEIQKNKLESLKKNTLSYLVLDKDNTEKLLQAVIQAWVYYHAWQKRLKRLTAAALQFHIKHRPASVFAAWKRLSQDAFRAQRSRKHLAIAEREKAQATQAAEDERHALRQKVQELTEALRQQTLQRAHFHYQYEQAMLRSMSAMTIENMTIQQNLIDKSRSITNTGKTAVYSAPLI